MNNQLNHYISIEPDFFQELEGEFGIKITGKLAIFLRTVEIVRPDRFMTSEMRWCGVGRKKLDIIFKRYRDIGELYRRRDFQRLL